MISELAEIERIGRQLLTMIDAQHIAITMAANGVFLLDRRGAALHLPVHPVQNANDIGAGDSFAAAMALALAVGASIDEAALIGIDAASIAVSKRWTSVVSCQELLQRASLRDHFSLTEVGSQESLSRLATQLEKERLAGRKTVFTNGVFDILHAGDIKSCGSLMF